MCCLLHIFARHSGSFSEGLAIPGRLGGGIPIEVALFRVRTGTSGVATMKLKYLVMLMLVPAVVGVAVPSALAQAPKASSTATEMQQPASPSTDMPTNSEGQGMGEHTGDHKARKSKKHRSHSAKPMSTGSATAPTKEAEENTSATR
ncbi:hypothetical protein AOT81_08540 [Xylella fastidiosa]|nr:hypothetical protein AOT81_08540 [Xylella fastidiosa]RWA45381.1 hypothetical protein XfCFBP8356_01290 [Xylella fastidiosa subsp. sandyi]